MRELILVAMALMISGCATAPPQKSEFIPVSTLCGPNTCGKKADWVVPDVKNLASR